MTSFWGVLLSVGMFATSASAQEYSAQEFKYQTPPAAGVATPDKVDTSIGTLNLRDGYPDAVTVQKIHDNLDASRALQPTCWRCQL